MYLIQLIDKYNISNIDDYILYLQLREEASELRIKGIEHEHPYFKKHPSCQNRRYMDRESQYFIRARNNYKGSNPVSDAVFHLIFRKFNTYNVVLNKFNSFPGDIIYKKKIEIIKCLNETLTPFTGAYLVPHRNKKFKTKVEGWLNLFDEVDIESIQLFDTTKDCFNFFKEIPGFGDFLACQFATELSWMNETKFNCNEFVVPGNGAIRGLNKLGVPGKKHIEFLHDLTIVQPITHQVWLPMTLMDYQNTFCEFDKFTRYLGNYDNQGREKMKRLRKPHINPITHFETTDKLNLITFRETIG